MNRFKLFRYFALLTIVVMFSGCSIRMIDFTIISSKNHALMFDKSKGVKTEGVQHSFLGIATTVKGALDKALENAGTGYDLLLDGVVYRDDYFFVAGFKVTGTAFRSHELISELGEDGYLKWLKGKNVFDPAIAEVKK